MHECIIILFVYLYCMAVISIFSLPFLVFFLFPPSLPSLYLSPFIFLIEQFVGQWSEALVVLGDELT